MGYFGCDYCGKADGLFDEHICDLEKVKENLKRVKDELLESRMKKDNAQAAVRRFIRLLSSELENKDVQHIIVPRESIEELSNDAFFANCNNDGTVNDYKINGKCNTAIKFCSPAHRLACEDYAYSGLLCAAFNIFRRNFSNLEELSLLLEDLYEDCIYAQQIFGYNDSKLVNNTSIDNIKRLSQ